ncbi:MAG: hypothetical protein V1915_02970 [Candidatus Bathyarchaeota archaeon]
MLNAFLAASRRSLDALLKCVELNTEARKEAVFSIIHKGKNCETRFEGSHFFLRTSTEYSSPQLTLEEVQGIIAARLLETFGNYLENKKNGTVEKKDLLEIVEALKKPPCGTIIPFLLNSDDTEPDRYSNNPLRASIANSGQSAFPVASVTTSSLKIDPEFVSKYLDSLISSNEVDFIQQHLQDFERYVDLVDLSKYDALERLSEILGINLCIPRMRMPLEILMKEKPGDPLHLVVQGSHQDYETIDTIYRLMGRSLKNKTTLLTTPHSLKGLGSKRSAKGKLVFDGYNLKSVDVKYRTIQLYPNMVDPNDLSQAKADDFISVEAKELTSYNYRSTPSTPQFALYIIHSPEQASISHGAGAYAGSEILKSYSSIYEAYIQNLIFTETPPTNILTVPLILNLAPGAMWLHPKHKNIDASIGCITSSLALLDMGMVVEHLNFEQETRSRIFEGNTEPSVRG